VPDLEPAEQVFHFYVLNNKTKPLKPTELRGTVSTSLSNEEIDGLYKRFKQAGVKSDEASWTHKLNTDTDSPFQGLVDFGFKDSPGFIQENVAFQVAKAFMKPARKYHQLVKHVDAWADDTFKLRLFYAMWGTIRALYKNAWDAAISNKNDRQILYKATMLCLQELLFDELTKSNIRRARKQEPSPLSNPSELEEEVQDALHFLPEEFFTREWQETGLDTKERRGFLKSQMEEAITRQGKNIGHLPLLKKNKQA
jgi:hypothetical protein